MNSRNDSQALTITTRWSVLIVRLEIQMRRLKRADTPILTGYQIYHNYLRLHEGLDNKIPAGVCGIKIDGKNKWRTLIENASKNS